MKFVKPKNKDAAFKKIFGNEKKMNTIYKKIRSGLCYFSAGFICLSVMTIGEEPCCALEEHSRESGYNEQWCSEHKGIREKTLKDKTRCDCVTETHAVESDYGKKWAEAIGQSLHYAAVTGKKAGIVLIIKNEEECRYLDRLIMTIESFHLPIDVWIEGEALCGQGSEYPDD